MGSINMWDKFQIGTDFPRKLIHELVEDKVCVPNVIETLFKFGERLGMV